MRMELDEALVRDFPNLYVDRNADMRTTCMCWGFECGDGWEPIIRRLSEKLEAAILQIKKDNPPRIIRFLAAKEAWNSLLRRLLIPRRGKTPRFMWRIFCILVADTMKTEYPRASQVKEKYGTLRFYMTSATSEMYDWITATEKESESVCEECGKPGKLRGYGWYYTACDEHTREEDRGDGDRADGEVDRED